MAADTNGSVGVSTRTVERRLLDGPPGASVLVLLAFHLAVALIVFLGSRSPDDHGDPEAQRFWEISNAVGRPYRDFPVEYAPLELVAIELVSGSSVLATHRGVVLLALVADLAIWWSLTCCVGRNTGRRYLWFCVPLLPLLFIRLDLLPVALSTACFAALRRGRWRLGGLALAAGALTKVWPALLAPALLLRRQRRAAIWFAASSAVMGAAWLAFAGVSALQQVATFRGAVGWHIESTIGTIVWIVTQGPIRISQGAQRVGQIPGAARIALFLALVVLITCVWLRSRRWSASMEGVPSLVAVTALIALSPLFSLQYAIWLLPWTAIAASEDERSQRFAKLSIVVLVLTGLISVFYLWTPYDLLIHVVQGLLLLRNGLCLALVATWFLPWPAVPARGKRFQSPTPPHAATRPPALPPAGSGRQRTSSSQLDQ